MATLVYIQGLSHRGFRVKDNTGAWKMCKKGVTIQVDLDAESTKKIIAREKNNFIRVATGASTTAPVLALSRRGFRIKDNTGAIKDVRLAIGQAATQTPVTVDLTKGDTLKLLKRNKGAAWIVASGPIVSIRGLQNEQAEGFYVKRNTQATGTVTVTTNAANGDTVTIAGKTYTFQTALTNVDGNVLIGASAAASAANLQAAITLGAGSGTAYAAATTANANVTATVNTNVVTVTALETTQPGTKGNSLALAKTGTNLTVSGATLTGGANAATANPTKVFDGQTVSVDIRVPHNFKQLRRYHKAWVEA